MRQFNASDLLAAAAIMGCLTLIAFHRDGTISSILMTLIGYYFGTNSQKRAK